MFCFVFLLGELFVTSIFFFFLSFPKYCLAHYQSEFKSPKDTDFLTVYPPWRHLLFWVWHRYTLFLHSFQKLLGRIRLRRKFRIIKVLKSFWKSCICSFLPLWSILINGNSECFIHLAPGVHRSLYDQAHAITATYVSFEKHGMRHLYYNFLSIFSFSPFFLGINRSRWSNSSEKSTMTVLFSVLNKSNAIKTWVTWILQRLEITTSGRIKQWSSYTQFHLGLCYTCLSFDYKIAHCRA